MELKYNYETLDINGVSVAEAIAALQAWETENPEATDTVFNVYSDGDYAFVEINFYRPYTADELEAIKEAEQKAAEWQERHERELYERLKEKFENAN